MRGIGYGSKKAPAQIAEELVSLVRKERTGLYAWMMRSGKRI